MSYQIMELLTNYIAGRDDSDGAVRSACNLCQNFCGLLAYKKNGRVIRLEGDPDNPRNYGHLCAKGLSGFLSLHSPKRVTKPLMRTNPEKGVGVDPKWKEISWSEAIDIFADRLRRLLQDPKGYDPRKILVSTFDHWGTYFGVQAAWSNALQCQKSVLSAACFCGNAVHPPSLLNTATFEITPDAEHARYLLLIGSQAGSIIHYDTMNVARHIAEKRPGEVKVVVVDPLCSHAASRSEEWIPIRPGTDAAFILALVNLLVNEYGLYDAKFLKEKTNAPYLIGENGLYVRDADSGKPLVWDPIDGKAKCFDEPNIKDYALSGSYVVNDAPCSPGFQLLKDHVKKYKPEKVSEITTIPAETIRRIAKEYGESACIGKTINIDGVEVPYRPVSVVWYRGLSAHKHAYLAGFAILLLPTLMGAIQVPGGIQGHPRAEEYVTDDGLMAVEASGVVRWRGPYPSRPVVKPKRLDLFELFPVAAYSSPMIIPALLEPERFGFDTDSPIPEILLMYRENPVRNTIAPEIVVEALKKIQFIVTFAVELDDTSNIADLVFPDLHYLERLAESMYNRVDEPGFWYAAKPSVSPPFDPPYNKLVNNAEVLLEVADRAGFLPQVVSTLNEMWSLQGTTYELDPKEKYSYLELADRRLRSWLGGSMGIDWLLSEEGGLLVWKAKPQERFKGAFRQGRLHLYYEFMVDAKKQVEEQTRELGLKWDVSDYIPIPEWKPCSAYEKRGGDYNLFLVNFKVPFQVHGHGGRNPILKQLNVFHHLDTILINEDTASRLGIRDGEEVWVETREGRKIRAVASVSQRVHPEVVATIQHPVAKGTDFNVLLTMDDERMDFVGCAVDSCVLVKVSKAS